MNGERKLALFMDFENIARGVKEAQYKAFEIKLVLERLLEKGKIIVRRAYADWNRFTEYKRPFHEWAIELIDVPQSRYSGKNSADIRMVVDALDLAYGKTHIDSLRARLRRLRLLAARLQAPRERPVRDRARRASPRPPTCSSTTATSSSSTRTSSATRRRPPCCAACPRRRPRRSPADRRHPGPAAREQGALWGSMVKQTMMRKNPAFNETYHGYSTFSKLLEDAAKQKIVTLERDEKSGTYVITTLSEEGGRAA